ncbi:MAG TPA: response regulator [Thermoanaerobaculia bacterium]|nr:response regulator [Thermoanaerobaculia bacterium]
MPRVLVIDDDPSTADLLREALAPWRIDVAVASGVQPAIDLLLTGAFIGVVLDLMISRGNSFDLLDAMRHANITTRVIVTSSRPPAFANDLLNPTQVLTILRKPFELDVVVAALLGLAGTQPADAAKEPLRKSLFTSS